MDAAVETRAPRFEFGIWAFAFGYFAAYVPYSASAKAVSKGLISGMDAPISGFSLLPVSVMASVAGMFTFLTLMKWWRFAGTRQVGRWEVPSPTRYTLISGLLTATIVVTTTLAYTFKGVSIVFIMLLMRGGVLIIAPIIDSLTGRTTRWFSWVGLVLSLSALVVAFSEEGGYDITLICAIDVFFYLGSYFLRLRFMSRLAKSEHGDSNYKYFVEEQMVATPSVLLGLVAVALIGPFIVGTEGQLGAIVTAVRAGFTDVWASPAWPWIIFIGLCSQFTGIFGGLILLDKRENTYCVPVNRCSSILAGVLASYVLYGVFDQGAPSAHKLIGAGLIITAILFLTFPPMLEKQRKRAAAEKA